MLGAATTSSVRVSRKLLHSVGGAGQTVYLPVVEDGQSEGLALCVSAQVRLEAKWVNGWDEGLDGVERRARDGSILGDVTPEGDTQHRATTLSLVLRKANNKPVSSDGPFVSLIILIPEEQSSSALIDINGI